MKILAYRLSLIMTHYLHSNILAIVMIVIFLGLILGILINKLDREKKAAEQFEQAFQVDRVSESDSSKRFMIKIQYGKFYFSTFSELSNFRAGLLGQYEIWERDPATGRWMYMGRGN